MQARCHTCLVASGMLCSDLVCTHTPSLSEPGRKGHACREYELCMAVCARGSHSTVQRMREFCVACVCVGQPLSKGSFMLSSTD